MVDQISIIVLTLLVIALNVVTAGRAFYTSLQLETTCDWLCWRGAKHCGVTILIGIGVICTILAMLKTWSVADIFVGMWDHMPTEYHIRSFAYLTENAGVAIVGWKVINLIKTIGACDGSHRQEG